MKAQQVEDNIVLATPYHVTNQCLLKYYLNEYYGNFRTVVLSEVPNVRLCDENEEVFYMHVNNLSDRDKQINPKYVKPVKVMDIVCSMLGLMDGVFEFPPEQVGILNRPIKFKVSRPSSDTATINTVMCSTLTDFIINDIMQEPKDYADTLDAATTDGEEVNAEDNKAEARNDKIISLIRRPHL